MQAALAASGVWIAAILYAGVLSALLLLACLVQIGPLLPLLGCVAWLYTHDAHVAALLLFVWSIGVSMIDNCLRPILIRRAVSLPMTLILAGVLGGVFSIGVAGLFLGSVILAVTYIFCSHGSACQRDPELKEVGSRPSKLRRLSIRQVAPS